MKRQLDRLLRIREILEDLSLLDFEGKTAEVRYLERAAERQRQLALSTRADALRVLAAGPLVRQDEWLMSIADAEICGWKEERLDALAEAEKPAVNRSREELLARRLERRQVEILRTGAAQAEDKRRLRQEQNRTDDWFQSGSARRNQRGR